LIVYLETSALVKLFLIEEGADEVAAVWNAADARVTSIISYPEARAALARASRERRFRGGAYVEARAQLERRFDQVDLVELLPAVARRAGDLAERHELRGFDAVHVASALATDAGDVVIASWDERVRRAAQAEGLSLAVG
jgi:uncharacterized protein